jgi:hypothetical protein
LGIVFVVLLVPSQPIMLIYQAGWKSSDDKAINLEAYYIAVL